MCVWVCVRARRKNSDDWGVASWTDVCDLAEADEHVERASVQSRYRPLLPHEQAT